MLKRSRTDGGPVPVEGASLLLISDNDTLSLLTGRVLESRGFKVDRADSPDDALVRIGIHEPPFAAVVMDLGGGTTEALKLLDKLRSDDNPDTASVRVVITSGVDENRLFSWQSGTDGFLVRPYHVDELIDLLVGSLARSDAERATFRQEQTQLAIEQHQQH